MRYFKQAQLEGNRFLRNYCSRQTIAILLLGMFAGFLPASYQAYETIETRLLFISIYGVLFFLFLVLAIVWIYQATHTKEKENPRLVSKSTLG